MARPIVVTKALTAANAAIIAGAQAVAAAGNLALVGGGTVILDTQRRVIVHSVGNDTGINFTIYGTTGAGAAISEVLTGANGGDATTAQDFLTVTRIAASGAAAGNVSAGTNTVGSTPWFVLNNHITPFEVAAEIEITAGAANVDLQVAYVSPLSAMPIYRAGYSTVPPVPTPVGWPGMTGIAATTSSVINSPVQAARLTVNSGTGTAQLVLTQAGIRN